MQLKYDRLLTVSFGLHRKDKNWKNTDILWSDLLNKFNKTHRTAETHAEYMAAKVTRQAEIKDVGGYVGGALIGGRRGNGKVLNRTMITLDIDFPVGDTWEDYTMLFYNAAAIYSTHKHSSAAPRLRLVIPLDRPVFVDEYEAIARKIAGTLGIDIFDSSTFQPPRLMYWPSTSKDGDFFYRFMDAPFLRADEILSSYIDWRDSSQWPTAARDHDAVYRSIKKQGDPTAKPGLVGAFCRTYNIHEAIETFLQEQYEPCEVEGRYTFKGGSTAAGLVTYDDVFAYSHHGTDPCSAKLCNAFDLVRLHLFGVQDDDALPETPVTKLPSYKSMCDFVGADAQTKLLIGSERYQQALTQFEAVPGVPVKTEPDNIDWLTELTTDRKGNYDGSIQNVYTILGNDVNLKGVFAFDSFRRQKVLLRSLPWRTVDAATKYIQDSDESNLRKYLEQVYKITHRSNILDALEAYIAANSFHPVRDYLQALQWDGTPRIDDLLVRYLGAEDTDYTRQVTRKTLVAAVARIMQPGIKFDYALTLCGEEGKGKSTLIRKLGGEWFSESFTTVIGKEAYEQIQGCWIIEMGELSALKRAEVEVVKHFISKSLDSYRPAFARNVVYTLRQCIFIGTTNEGEPLRGTDGNRRFWIVDIGRTAPLFDIKDDDSLNPHERSQIWAEALHYYEAGESIFLDDELENEARRLQKEHSEHDDRTGIISRYLETLLPASWSTMEVGERRGWLGKYSEIQEEGTVMRTKVCVAEIWCEALGNSIKDINRFNTKDIHNLMKTMDGWRPHKSSKSRFGIYGLQKAYTRVNEDFSMQKVLQDGNEIFNF